MTARALRAERNKKTDGDGESNVARVGVPRVGDACAGAFYRSTTNRDRFQKRDGCCGISLSILWITTRLPPDRPDDARFEVEGI